MSTSTGKGEPLPPGVRVHGAWYQKQRKKRALPGQPPPKGSEWVKLSPIAEGRKAMQAALKRYETGEDAPVDLKAKAMTVRQLIAQTLAWLEKYKQVGSKTLVDYKQYGKVGGALDKSFGDLHPSEVTQKGHHAVPLCHACSA